MKRNAKGQFVSDKKSETPPEEKVYAVGFKGFGPGMVCRGKQYAENTVFEEDEAKICNKGMHFCEHPLDVFGYYPPVSDNGKMNEFATVESLAEPKTDDNQKFCTTKIKIGAKLDIAGMVKAAIDFVFAKATPENTEHATGDYGAASATGDYGAASATGFQGAASATGFQGAASATGSRGAASATGSRGAASATGSRGAASATGKESFAIATGIYGKVKAALGCFIACAEWKEIDDEWHPVCFKSAKVDGKKIKADTWYAVKDGKFVEADND